MNPLIFLTPQINRRGKNLLTKHVYYFVVILVVGLIFNGCGQEESYPDQKVINYLNLDVQEYYRQKNLYQSGLQEIFPVILPEGEFEIEGEASGYLFGWPHAGMIDDIILVTIRNRGLIRSTNGGKSWEEPQFFDNARIVVIGNTKSGKVVAAAVDRQNHNTLNVLISEDKGVTWSRHSTEVINTTPHLTARIIEHPKYGLISGGHFTRDSLSFLVSEDDGQTWRSVSFPVNVPLNNHGTVVFKDGDDNLGVFVRNHEAPGPWQPFAQFSPINQDNAERFEDLNWKGGLTNIWVRKSDTSDAIYNPVSKRIEAVTTKRDWGFPQRDRGYMTLNLWSIAPEAFQNGSNNWRYEGTLLRSMGEKARSMYPRDGMHPVGSIIDEERGEQHIFIYSGNRAHGSNPSAPKSGRTGIFRITRTLDTEKWVKKNRELENYHEIYRIDENFNSFANWNKSGSPSGEMVLPRTEPPNRIEVDLPEGTLKADERGHLHIKTSEPGYYGLHNEQIIATNNYKLEFKTKIERFPQFGYPLGIHVNYGAEKYDLIIKKDGVYQMDRENLEDLKKIIDIEIDNEWHVWKVEVKRGQSQITMDEEHIGSGSTRIDGGIGHRPISISAWTTDDKDVAEARVEYFRFENIEIDNH